tara:strand:+ start:4318 stop:4428 length:111 start_codon:yes stop_codon:yes gene_type:complete
MLVEISSEGKLLPLYTWETGQARKRAALLRIMDALG